MRLIRSTVLSVLLGACAVPALAIGASAQIVISVGVPPPPLPIYEQPIIPAVGYIWTPGYWAYEDDDGYYWVPGTWVEAPEPGLLWTPAYWGFDNGAYRFHDGYWADHVGFYGGVDYGYGYNGSGYEGGYWRDRTFFYNRTVNNITNVNVVNVYSKTVVTNARGNRVSYNGGQGGLAMRPTAQQQTVMRGKHVQATAIQREHVQTAAHDPALRETQNKGRPPIAATSRPNDFKGQGVVPAKTGGVRPAGQAAPRGKNAAGAPNGAAPGPNGQRLGQPGATTPGANGQRPGQPATNRARHQRATSRRRRAPTQPRGAGRENAWGNGARRKARCR